MPMFEYRCNRCGREFERLVIGNREVDCPGCGSADLRKLFSVFAVKSGNRSASSTSSCGSCTASSCSNCH